jgi:hypothetical protein
VQFQGMIAEYVHAQIAERCRRGKRHRAQQGMINVLSGAPFGYRYVRKSESSAAYYEVIEAEAKVVRMVFEAHTPQGLSINAIARFVIASRFPPRFGRRGGMDCSHYLPLRHLIDCIEVIHAVDSVQVTLMYRVHSQVSRPALRVRFASPPTLTFVGRVG